MPKPQQKPIEERNPYAAMALDAYDRMEPPSDWFCDCKDSTIRWVDEKRPHMAVRGPGWFCMGCLQEFFQKSELIRDKASTEQ